MEDKTPRSQRPAYTGRFADPAQSAPPHAGATVRARAGTAGGASRRPSGFAAPDAQKKRPETRPAQKGKTEAKPARKGKSNEKPAREEKVRNKRRKRVKLELWQLGLIVVAALALLIVVLVLIFGGGRGGTYHQLPRVERGSDSAYAPEETVAAGADAAATEAQGAADDELPGVSAASDPNAAFANMFSGGEQAGGEVADADMSELESAFEGMDPGAFDDAGAAEDAAGLLESGELDANALDVGELDASDFSEASELFDTSGLDGTGA